MRPGRLLSPALACALAGCATSGYHPPDLASARQALEAARQAGASEKAPDTFTEAQGHLAEAERLAAARAPEARETALRAEWMARLALARAECAAATKTTQAAQEDKAAARSQEVDRITARLRKSEEEQRRLEERITLQQRELDVTETELIRTKARLKGIETKAEASSAIAEARILLRRLDPRSRAPILSLCQDSLAKAEQQLQQENYGAALFFALKAQDLAVKAQDSPDAARRPPPSGEELEQSPPQKSYVVKAKKANIRKGPSLTDPVIGEAPQGATLEATAIRGEWVKVAYRGTSGWVHRSVLE